MITRAMCRETAENFWSAAGGRDRYGTPADVAKAASVAMPVSVVSIQNLDTSCVASVLRAVRSDPWFVGTPRPLRGCLVADGGHALIFVEKSDAVDEQRFTVAHELAHLLLHYLAPRREAVRHFGQVIQPVLDRTRPPTYTERMDSAMSNVPIEPFRHAMDRTARSGVSIERMEDEADDLAVELLAPWAALRTYRNALPSDLRKDFGLPAPVAARLASLIAQPPSSEGVIGLFCLK